MWIAGEPYVNVLRLNLVLIQEYPAIYQSSADTLQMTSLKPGSLREIALLFLKLGTAALVDAFDGSCGG